MGKPGTAVAAFGRRRRAVSSTSLRFPEAPVAVLLSSGDSRSTERFGSSDSNGGGAASVGGGTVCGRRDMSLNPCVCV